MSPNMREAPSAANVASTGEKVHEPTCLAQVQGEELPLAPAHQEWHRICSMMRDADGDRVCTHPHREPRTQADMAARATYWATAGKLTDKPLTPDALRASASDKPTDGACSWQPSIGPRALQILYAAPKVFMCHLMISADYAPFHSVFGCLYGLRLVHAAMLEDKHEPFIGSYVHSTLHVFFSHFSLEVSHKYMRLHQALFNSFVERAIERIEMDVVRIRKGLVIDTKHRCCLADFDRRREELQKIVESLSCIVQRLHNFRPSMLLRLFDITLRFCGRGKDGITPKRVVDTAMNVNIVSPAFDALLRMWAGRIVHEQKRIAAAPASVGHDAGCGRICKCRRCSGCGSRNGAQMRCSTCNFGEYCSKECFKKAWPAHRMLCMAVEEDPDPAFRPYTYRLLKDDSVDVRTSNA